MQKITITEYDGSEWDVVEEIQSDLNSVAIVKPNFGRDEEYLAPYWYVDARNIYLSYNMEFDTIDDLIDEYGLSSAVAKQVDEWFRSGGAETNSIAGNYKGEYDCIAELCTIMYGKPYEATEFHGYSQGDFAECIYDTTEVSEDYLRYVESVFMGMCSDLHFEDTEDDYDEWTTVTNDDLWEAERSSDVAKAFGDLIGVNLDPGVIIYDEINNEYILGDEEDEYYDEDDESTYEDDYDLDTISQIN